jgi:hypothetical protein
LCPDLCPIRHTPAHIKGTMMDRLIRGALKLIRGALNRVSPVPIALREDPRADAAASDTAVQS